MLAGNKPKNKGFDIIETTYPVCHFPLEPETCPIICLEDLSNPLVTISRITADG